MLIDGKAIAKEIQKEIKMEISQLKGRKPSLAVIIVGNNPASLIYVNRKTKACAEVGIDFVKIALPHSIAQQELLSQIQKLNAAEPIDGILLQLPLPSTINPLTVLNEISPSKDVDGLHPLNAGKLLLGNPHTFIPCTPLGIKELLIRSNIETAGKHVVILGRSNLVGKPLAAALMQNTNGGNATVTIAHSHSKNLKNLCSIADILIAAIGQPLFVKADMVKQGAVVIDVGINKIKAHNALGYAIVGDVDFDKVAPKCSYISPVPGGVGPMTIAMLLHNTLKSYHARL